MTSLQSLIVVGGFLDSCTTEAVKQSVINGQETCADYRDGDPDYLLHCQGLVQEKEAQPCEEYNVRVEN